MSPTELMSKSTGSALGLTGGRAERQRGMMGMREGGRGGEMQEDRMMAGERERENEGEYRSCQVPRCISGNGL